MQVVSMLRTEPLEPVDTFTVSGIDGVLSILAFFAGAVVRSSSSSLSSPDADLGSHSSRAY
jgi:hypothetical protein